MRVGTISSVAELCNHSIFIRTESSYLLLRFGTFNSFHAGLVGAKIECAVHAACCSAQTARFNKFSKAEKKFYCPNVFIGCVTVAEKPRHFDCFILQLVVL